MSQYQHQPVVLPHTIIFSENFSRLTACRSYVTSDFRDKFKNGCSFLFLIEMDKIQTVPLDYLAIDFLF